MKIRSMIFLAAVCFIAGFVTCYYLTPPRATGPATSANAPTPGPVALTTTLVVTQFFHGHPRYVPAPKLLIEAPHSYHLIDTKRAQPTFDEIDWNSAPEGGLP